ncbi:hypothetical protein KEM54_005490 [Ascosphaera aggregata]|nr:hypothetical protein KEM54_005490 [Ascosphaera aggregata]
MSVTTTPVQTMPQQVPRMLQTASPMPYVPATSAPSSGPPMMQHAPQQPQQQQHQGVPQQQVYSQPQTQLMPVSAPAPALALAAPAPLPAPINSADFPFDPAAESASFLNRANAAIDNFESVLMEDAEDQEYLRKVLRSARNRVLHGATESSFPGGEPKDEAVIIDAIKRIIGGLRE